MPSADRSVRGRIIDCLPQCCAAGCFLLALTVTAALTGQWCWLPNGYNSYALQADAWLHGRLDLGQDYPWLELAIYQGRYYVSFPPFPSIALLPFALFLGPNTPDGIISVLFSLAGVWTCVSIARRCGNGSVLAVLATLCLYLGTGYLFIGLTPGVWFFAQTLCFNLCVFALYFALTVRGGLSLTCWACAVGCRPMVILYLPALLLILWRSYRLKHPRDSLLSAVRKHLHWALGPLFFGGVYMLLNVCRFGNILEFGHNYLPEFQREAQGQFSFSYLADNVPMLFRLPVWDPETHAIRFSPFETYLLPLMNPLGVYAAALCCKNAISSRERQERTLCRQLLAMTAVYIIILCCHRTLGGWQFGNRYLKDVMPFLFFGLCQANARKKSHAPLAMIAAWSIPLHLIGTVATWNYWW